jgi:aryl-alcohol dehydrogenase-like predicted oxidoreductase
MEVNMNFKQLGHTGTLVSELCLGTMTFGGKGFWEAIGRMTQDEATKMVKKAIENKINFIDTANIYSEGLSELMLGKALKDLGIDRQDLVIATKVRGRMGPGPNQIGLSQLHIINSVNDSLKRLQMDHIDLLYIHGVDPITPLEETMRALEDVVRAGKVRYLGISNHPAWKVMKANAIAERNGWTRFTALQNFYSIAARDIERELIPLAESEGLALMPWSPLAGGFVSGKYSRSEQKAGDSRRDEFDFPPLNKEKTYNIIDVMTEIGREREVSAARIALAWLLRKNCVTSIIIGAKNNEQLMDNIASTGLYLSDEEMEKLDNVSELTPEYPGWMVTRQSEGRWPQVF